jgi:hypothetical protein
MPFLVRTAAALLLAAGIPGLIHPAAGLAAETDPDPLALPRVVPPPAPPSVQTPAAIKPASAQVKEEAAPADDLLAVPPLPSAWSARPAAKRPPAHLTAGAAPVTAKKDAPASWPPAFMKAPPADDAAGEALERPASANVPEAERAAPQTRKDVREKTEEAPPRAPAFPSTSPLRLQKRVAIVCGRLAKEVRVEVRGDRVLEVKVRLANSGAEKPVLQRVLGLPEMQGPGVRLELSVDP